MATILVVDDERPVREFLSEALADAGHHILQALHGQQALAVLERARPDLVLSDLMMPLMDGRELCQVLKDDPATARIPVVLMTAAAPRVLEGARADAVLRKPFDLDALDAVIERLLGPRAR